MPVEDATYISGLNDSYPIGESDFVSQGDDHLRLVKKTVLNTFPNITGAVSASHTALNTVVDAVNKSGNETIAGNKTFTGSTVTAAISTGQLTTTIDSDSQIAFLKGTTNGIRINSSATEISLEGVNAANTQYRPVRVYGNGFIVDDTAGGNHPLRVNHTSGSGAVRVSDGTVNFDVFNGSGVGYIGTTTNHPLIIRTNNTNRVQIGTDNIMTVSMSVIRLGGYPTNYIELNGNTGAGTGLYIGEISGTSSLWQRKNQSFVFGTNNTERINISTSGPISVYGLAGIPTFAFVSNAATNCNVTYNSNSHNFFTGVFNSGGSFFWISGDSNTRMTLSQSGQLWAPKIHTSISTTLQAGTIHHITVGATLPSLAEGEWICVINNSASPITIAKGSNTTFWTANGATVATSFTLGARGRMVASGAGSSVSYVGGDNITGAT